MQKVVVPRVSDIPATDAGGERVFSAVAHVWTDKRNRLLMGKAAMLSYVYFNHRVQERIDAVPDQEDWEEWVGHMEERERAQVEYVTISEEEAASIAAVNPNMEGPLRKKRSKKQRSKGGNRGGKKAKKSVDVLDLSDSEDSEEEEEEEEEEPAVQRRAALPPPPVGGGPPPMPAAAPLPIVAAPLPPLVAPPNAVAINPQTQALLALFFAQARQAQQAKT